MKYLLPLIILFTVAVSCKKKETNSPSTPNSKGDFLILVVSDSLECAMEYRQDELPSSSLNESPVLVEHLFTNGKYRITIYAYGVGLYGTYYLDPSSNCVDEFPQFEEFYSNTFIDSIPGNRLKRNVFYSVDLDTSKVDFVPGSNYPEELETAWNKIRNLQIVNDYRMKFPQSQIGFLYLKKSNGEKKRYFFINKYEP